MTRWRRVLKKEYKNKRKLKKLPLVLVYKSYRKIIVRNCEHRTTAINAMG
jgi:hypothetical protein